MNPEAEHPYLAPRKAVITGNSCRHIRVYGNPLTKQDGNIPAVHLEQDYVFKALPETLEQESGLLPDCNSHSGFRALVLVVQRISAGSNLLLDSLGPLDSFNIVSASPEVDVFENPGNVGCSRIKVRRLAVSSCSIWDEDSGGEANVSWAIAT